MSGLKINGVVIPVPCHGGAMPQGWPNRVVISPDDTKWAHLNAGDGTPRSWKPSQYVLHKTLADDPEKVLPGVGPPGGAERTAESWDEDPKHSGAQLVTGHDGVTACLEDLHLFEAWHGNQSNERSVGHEIKEMPGGGVYLAALEAAVDVCLVACENLGIQFQCPSEYHNNIPLPRYADGGKSLTGIFGHRDITDSRNRWDPGDVIFEMLAARGVERFNFYTGQDRTVWKSRQEMLNTRYKAGLIVDGLPGPATRAVLLKIGYRSGIWALGKA